MRRFALISSLVLTALVVSAVAWADPPTHMKKQTFSGTFSAPAGQVCDFDYAGSFTIDQNIEVFGDPNNPTKFVLHETQSVTHTNLDTGYTLTEVDHAVTTVDLVNNVGKQVGLVWHLRDPSGKIVVVQAGQILYDATTGEVIRVTPNLNPSLAAVICPALGGHPAS